VQPATKGSIETLKVAGFVLWERESEEEGEEVKDSEAHTCNVHVNALFGSGDGSYGEHGVRRSARTRQRSV